MSDAAGRVSGGSDQRQRVEAVGDVLTYASDDYSVLPVVEDTKRPATSHGKDDATTDADAVNTMFKPGHNVGIVWPAGVLGIDADPSKDDGEPLPSAGEYADELAEW